MSSRDKAPPDNANDGEEGWIFMTETIISDDGDIKCSSLSKNMDLNSTSSSTGKVTLANNAYTTSTMPKSEASPKASRHLQLEPKLRHYDTVNVGNSCLSQGKNGYGYCVDRDVDIDTDTCDEEDNGVNYTFTPFHLTSVAIDFRTSDSSQSSQSQLSNIPRTSHHLTRCKLQQLFPTLNKNIISKHAENFPLPPSFIPTKEILSKPEQRRQRYGVKEAEAEAEAEQKQQNSALDGGGKSTDISNNMDMSSQLTTPINFTNLIATNIPLHNDAADLDSESESEGLDKDDDDDGEEFLGLV